MKKTKKELLDDWSSLTNFSGMFEKGTLIFDGELRSLHEAAKRMYDIIDQSYQRFCRHRALEVNPSLIKYWEMKELSSKYPQISHTFRWKGTEISLARFKDDFTVVVIGWDPPTDVSVTHIPFSDCYGRFEKLEDAFDTFSYCVHTFLDLEVQNGLF